MVFTRDIFIFRSDFLISVYKYEIVEKYVKIMSLLLETTVGDLVIDLNFEEFSTECYNFINLCISGFYIYQCFYNLNKNYSVEIGDPLYGNENRKELRLHNTSFEGILDRNNISPKLIQCERSLETIENTLCTLGRVGFILSERNTNDRLFGSKIMFALNSTPKLFNNVVMFGNVTENSKRTLELINSVLIDSNKRPEIDIRVKKSYLIYNPFPSIIDLPIYEPELPILDIRLPSGPVKHLHSKEIIKHEIRNKELFLEAVGDIPTINIQLQQNVLFICKLNPATRARDIATIFQRFGEINSVEIVYDKLLGRSLGYGFIEFTNKKSCETAYHKMEGALIDDRRIHVDFCQSSRRSKGYER